MARVYKRRAPLAVAGAVVRRTKHGVQRVRTCVQWCDEREEAFLDALAASCHVTRAAEEAGVSHTSVYRQRRTSAGFAVKWQAALEQGYARLEIEMVRAATEAVTGVDYDADRPIGPMTAETALNLLKLHRASVTGMGRRSGWAAPVRSIDEVGESILRKIRVIREMREREDGREREGAAEDGAGR